MTMRALHVIPSLDIADGGPSIALPQMARGLQENGVEVEIITTLTATAKPPAITWGEPTLHDGCNVRFFPRQSHFYKFSLPLHRWLQTHVREYDIVHNHAVFSFAPLSGSFAARRQQIPYLIRPLGLLNRYGMTQRRPWIKRLSFAVLDRPALNGAAAIHYTSRQEMEEASSLGLTSPGIVLPLGIDAGPYQSLPPPGRFHELHPGSLNRRVILFLSRIDPKKGLDLLLPAFKKIHSEFPETLLVVAGDGDPGYVTHLQGLALDLGIGDHVLWPGFLTGGAKLAAFAVAEFFILPSYSENFGIALLEAMMAGLPCMASDQVALVHDTPGAVATFPCLMEEISDTMRRLLHDRELRLALGSRGRLIANQRFSIASTGAQLANFYRSTVSSAQLPPYNSKALHP